MRSEVWRRRGGLSPCAKQILFDQKPKKEEEPSTTNFMLRPQISLRYNRLQVDKVFMTVFLLAFFFLLVFITAPILLGTDGGGPPPPPTSSHDYAAHRFGTGTGRVSTSSFLGDEAYLTQPLKIPSYGTFWDMNWTESLFPGSD